MRTFLPAYKIKMAEHINIDQNGADRNSVTVQDQTIIPEGTITNVCSGDIGDTCDDNFDRKEILTKLSTLTDIDYKEMTDNLETDSDKNCLEGEVKKEKTNVYPDQKKDRLLSSSSDATTIEAVTCSSSASMTSLEYKSDSGSTCTLNLHEKNSSNDVSSMVDAASNSNLPRPDSLLLPKSLQKHDWNKEKISDGQKLVDYINDNVNSIKEWRTCRSASTSTAVEIPARRDPEFENIEETSLSKSLPHGTILKKGDMIEFVAEDLQEKIRQSSPRTKTESSGLSSRTSSLRSISSISSSIATSATSGMSRSPSSQFQQSPDDVPPIDPHAVMELENQAKRVADSLDLMMGNLKSNLHKMSAITVGCLDAYKVSVDVTCDSVDSSIKSMYALMAKCEELSNSMQPIYKLADQVKEIKRLLERFELQLTEKTIP